MARARTVGTVLDQFEHLFTIGPPPGSELDCQFLATDSATPTPSTTPPNTPAKPFTTYSAGSSTTTPSETVSATIRDNFHS